MAVLTLDGVVKDFAGPRGVLRVLDGVSLTLSSGETAAIVGPSGSGKSTLLNCIGALDRPTLGTVRLDDGEVTTLGGAALAAYRATHVGFIFQDHHLLPQLTAWENVLLPTLAAGTREGAAARARQLLERMGIAERADAFPAQMSGGERQRAAVARALVNGADLLLCDEPTGNLDRAAGEAVVDLLLPLAVEGVIIIMVTHNRELAARFGRVLELRAGRLSPLQEDPT
ncbi:MAG TPA: ABC transporter ATP-binding protein [Armatimonadota bacterium]|nr:ABC transporter ATP-binding protein [Armatimonadota bacterium]